MTLRTHLRLLALSAIAIGLVAGAAVANRQDDDGRPRVAGRLAPTPGPNSDGYVQAKRGYLERIARDDPDRPSAGLVSLAALSSAAEAERLVGGMEVEAVFVTFPEAEPEALPVRDGLRAAVASRAKELSDVVRAEIVSLEAQLREAEGARRAEIERSLAERRQALLGLGTDCRCVYAVVVEGTDLAGLRRLQQRPEVRLVDVPDPPTRDLAGWELTPILPSPPP